MLLKLFIDKSYWIFSTIFEKKLRDQQTNYKQLLWNPFLNYLRLLNNQSKPHLQWFFKLNRTHSYSRTSVKNKVRNFHIFSCVQFGLSGRVWLGNNEKKFWLEHSLVWSISIIVWKTIRKCKAQIWHFSALFPPFAPV